MLSEAIILAGGLGTRLKGVINDIPKPMAPIGHIPFLQFLFDYLNEQGITHAVLAVGYKYEVIEKYFGNKYKNIELTYAIEHEPLGTGGGIANAIANIKNNCCFLLNGDTFFNVDLEQLHNQQLLTNAHLTLSLKNMENFDRYGTVEIDQQNRITSFNEKQSVEKGLINGGVYVITKKIFEPFTPNQKFSFEKDIMENEVNNYVMQAYISDEYFIDIGIPSDYEKANKELPMLFSI